MNWFTSLPQWFQMSVVALVVIGIVYRLFRYGVKIKAGSVEIDADNNSENSSSESKLEKSEETK